MWIFTFWSCECIVFQVIFYFGCFYSPYCLYVASIHLFLWWWSWLWCMYKVLQFTIAEDNALFMFGKPFDQIFCSQVPFGQQKLACWLKADCLLYFQAIYSWQEWSNRLFWASCRWEQYGKDSTRLCWSWSVFWVQGCPGMSKCKGRWFLWIFRGLSRWFKCKQTW